MTRKDYEKLAAALAKTRPERGSYSDPSAEFAQWVTTRNAVTHALSADNPRFDRGRFLVATEAE